MRVGEMEEEESIPMTNRRREPPPHYWPADKVPNLPISYCELIQGILGFCLVTMIIYVICAV